MKTIAHVTDAHIGQKLLMGDMPLLESMSYGDAPDEHKENLRVVLDDIARRGITELVFGGDIGTKASNTWFFDLIGRYRMRLRVVLGNHDSFSEVRRHFDPGIPDLNGELRFAYEDEYARHIYLDTSPSTVGDDQLSWLRQTIDGSSRTILFVHHPVLEIGTLLDQSAAALRGRKKLKAALRDSGSDVSVFCGHYHMDDETTEANIRQFSTPATSYQIEKQPDAITINRTFGYRIITLDRTDLKTSVIRFQDGCTPN